MAKKVKTRHDTPEIARSVAEQQIGEAVTPRGADAPEAPLQDDTRNQAAVAPSKLRASKGGKARGGMNTEVFTPELLAHADRILLAAREDRERCMNSAKIMGGALVALVGLGLFRLEWGRDPTAIPTMTESAAFAVKIFLTLAMACFVISILILMFRQRSNRPNSESEDLNLPSGLFMAGEFDSAKGVLIATFEQIYTAAMNIQDGNRERRARIARALLPFCLGCAFVAVALLINLWTRQ